MRQLFSALFGTSRAAADQSPCRSASDERDALARALVRATVTAATATTQAPSTLVFFTSPRCGLCRSLAPDVRRAREEHGAWLDVVEVTADAEGGGSSSGAAAGSNGSNGDEGNSNGPSAWAPEMLAFGVEAVPCFVLLSGREKGRAVARSGRPRGKAHAQRSLAALVRLAGAESAPFLPPPPSSASF